MPPSGPPITSGLADDYVLYLGTDGAWTIISNNGSGYSRSSHNKFVLASTAACSVRIEVKKRVVVTITNQQGLSTTKNYSKNEVKRLDIFPGSLATVGINPHKEPPGTATLSA